MPKQMQVIDWEMPLALNTDTLASHLLYQMWSLFDNGCKSTIGNDVIFNLQGVICGASSRKIAPGRFLDGTAVARRSPWMWRAGFTTSTPTASSILTSRCSHPAVHVCLSLPHVRLYQIPVSVVGVRRHHSRKDFGSQLVCEFLAKTSSGKNLLRITPPPLQYVIC